MLAERPRRTASRLAETSEEEEIEAVMPLLTTGVAETVETAETAADMFLFTAGVAVTAEVAAMLAARLRRTLMDAETVETPAMLAVICFITRGVAATVEAAAMAAVGLQVKAGRVIRLVKPRRIATPSPETATPVIFQAAWKKRYSSVRVTVPPGVQVTVEV
jgi:hypothetical protein